MGLLSILYKKALIKNRDRNRYQAKVESLEFRYLLTTTGNSQITSSAATQGVLTAQLNISFEFESAGTITFNEYFYGAHNGPLLTTYTHSETYGFAKGDTFPHIIEDDGVSVSFPGLTESETPAAVNGDSASPAYAGSTDSSINFVTLIPVTPPALKQSITALVSTPNMSNFGQSVTFVATVSPTTTSQTPPTGTVTFKDGSTVIQPPNIPLVAGVATLPDSLLSVGTHSITAVYSGDSNYSGSTSNLVTQSVITPLNPTISLTSLSETASPSNNPGINFTYTVTGTLSQNATINFYWAASNSLTTITSENSDPAYSYTLDSADAETPGIHGPVFVPRNDFTDVPYGTTYLLATVSTGGAVSTAGVHMFQPLTVDEILQIIPPPVPPTPVTIPKGKLTSRQKSKLEKSEKTYAQNIKTYNIKNSAYIILSTELVDYLNSREAFETYQINYPERQAAFIGQVAIESAHLTTLTQGKPFRDVAEKGGTAIGRGYLQITGSSNYRAAATFLGHTLKTTETLLATNPQVAASISGWYWDGNTGLKGGPVNSQADDWNITAVSQLINAGRTNPVYTKGPNKGKPLPINGLQKRETYSDKALVELISEINS